MKNYEWKARGEKLSYTDQVGVRRIKFRFMLLPLTFAPCVELLALRKDANRENVEVLATQRFCTKI